VDDALGVQIIHACHNLQREPSEVMKLSVTNRQVGCGGIDSPDEVLGEDAEL
jgi:hypothetical protein